MNRKTSMKLRSWGKEKSWHFSSFLPCTEYHLISLNFVYLACFFYLPAAHFLKCQLVLIVFLMCRTINLVFKTSRCWKCIYPKMAFTFLEKILNLHQRGYKHLRVYSEESKKSVSKMKQSDNVFAFERDVMQTFLPKKIWRAKWNKKNSWISCDSSRLAFT